MDYGCAALDLLMLARLAEHELAIERTHWRREHDRIEDTLRLAKRAHAAASRNARRAEALRLLAAPPPRRAQSTITRAVRRVAGSLRALAASE